MRGKARRWGDLACRGQRIEEGALKWPQSHAEGLDLILGYWGAMAEFKAGEGHSHVCFVERPLWLLQGTSRDTTGAGSPGKRLGQVLGQVWGMPDSARGGGRVASAHTHVSGFDGLAWGS